MSYRRSVAELVPVSVDDASGIRITPFRPPDPVKPATTLALIKLLPPKPLSWDPMRLFAFTLDYSTVGMIWTIADDTLTTVVAGNPSANLSIDLTAYTLTSLVAFINGQAGYSATLRAGVNGALGARTLLDGTNSNFYGPEGNRVYIFQSLTWALMDTFASALKDAAVVLSALLSQMRLDQAVGEWSDFWRNATIGGLRITGESDGQQNTRVIAGITQIKSTNKALENIIKTQTGFTVSVRDINWFTSDNTFYTYGPFPWNSAMLTNDSGYGTFPYWGVDGAVVSAYSLNLLPWGPPAYGSVGNNQPLIDAFAVIFPFGSSTTTRDKVMALINQYRAGGTVALPYIFTSGANTTFTPF